MTRPRRTRPRVIDEADRLLTPGEVAKIFRVDPKTVTRWAAKGRIGSIRTPGNHRRFRESEVKALLLMPDQSSTHPTGVGPNNEAPQSSESKKP